MYLYPFCNREICGCATTWNKGAAAGSGCSGIDAQQLSRTWAAPRWFRALSRNPPSRCATWPPLHYPELRFDGFCLYSRTQLSTFLEPEWSKVFEVWVWRLVCRSRGRTGFDSARSRCWGNSLGLVQCNTDLGRICCVFWRFWLQISVHRQTVITGVCRCFAQSFRANTRIIPWTGHGMPIITDLTLKIWTWSETSVAQPNSTHCWRLVILATSYKKPPVLSASACQHGFNYVNILPFVNGTR